MSCSVSLATAQENELWEMFVQANSDAHHSHSWLWRNIISESFGHQPYYLICRKSDQAKSEVVGVLPLFLVQSLLFGRALISVPYLNGGGVLAKSQEAWQALVSEATTLAHQLNVHYVEFRYRGEPTYADSSLAERKHKASMILALESDAEQIFAKFPAKLRSQIRRPEKAGLTCHVSGDNREETISAFYRVFSQHMRDLGTPVYPIDFFTRVKAAFGDRARVFSVFSGKHLAAGAITLRFGTSVEIPWASALKRFHHDSPNMLLYWHTIRQACLDQATTFDFGRSSYDSGTYRFKQQWGAAPLPLHWNYLLRKGVLPDVNPNNPKYAFFVSCWKHLPLTVTNFLGPHLSRSLP